PPMLVSLIYRDGSLIAFVHSLGAVLGTGMLVWLPVRRIKADQRNLRLREGFLIVSGFWCVLGVFGALPLILGVPMTFTDGVFESISGFTTTGATVLVGV